METNVNRKLNEIAKVSKIVNGNDTLYTNVITREDVQEIFKQYWNEEKNSEPKLYEVLFRKKGKEWEKEEYGIPRKILVSNQNKCIKQIPRSFADGVKVLNRIKDFKWWVECICDVPIRNRDLKQFPRVCQEKYEIKIRKLDFEIVETRNEYNRKSYNLIIHDN